MDHSEATEKTTEYLKELLLREYDGVVVEDPSKHEYSITSEGNTSRHVMEYLETSSDRGIAMQDLANNDPAELYRRVGDAAVAVMDAWEQARKK